MKSTTPASSSAELDSRLNSYSKAALAVAAVGALTTTEAAAQVVVHNITSINVTNGTLDDVNQFSFQIGNQAHTFQHFVAASAQWMGRGGDQLVLLPNNNSFAENLAIAADKNIGPSKGFNGDVLLARHSYSGSIGGNFWAEAGGAATGYIGFRAVQSGHNYYGWLRIKVNGTSVPTGVALLPKDGTNIYGAYAIDGIVAGQVASAVPEPATVATSLGLLALGAAGVREFRRRQRAAA